MSQAPFKMFISEPIATQRKTNFTGRKHKWLTGIIKRPETELIFFDKDQLTELLTLLQKHMGKDSGLRIYFATYQKLPSTDDLAKKNNVLIPPNGEDLMTLIFAPTIWTGKASGIQEDHSDTGDYFVLHPGKSKFINLKETDPGIFTRWTQYYDELKRKPLSKHFKIEETKSMWYEYDNIKNFSDYLFDANDKVQGLNIQFACYHDNDEASIMLNNGKPASFQVSKQLTLVFSIEINEEMNENKAQAFATGAALNKQILNGDTGVPCPPGMCK